MRADHLEWLRRECLIIEPCGSRVTCNPPPMTTDEDWLVQVAEESVDPGVPRLEFMEQWLLEQGFKLEGNEDYLDEEGMEFGSWRREEVNLIVTQSPLFVVLHRLATKMCTRLNLLRKEDRIALFEAVMYQSDVDSSERKSRRKRIEQIELFHEGYPS